MDTVTHPSRERLAAFLEGRLSPAEQAETERHVAECESCCQALGSIPDDTLAGNLRAGNTQLDPFANIERTPEFADADGIPPELRDHPRYRVFKLLGKGGMGEVYLAEHRLMERMVALKVIKRAITQDPQAVERFRNEVKAAARLSHANIVAAHDAEQAGEVHFLVMEFIDGISLARLVDKRGRLAIMQACNYVRQAALGLQHAFEHGMIHRDIKPQNLMLDRKGRIKILDFGLARFASDEGGRITELGAVLGTPDYIAPEQVTNARKADIRADIYSLGCTLYYLLAGQTPFPTGSQTQKILAHVDRAPQPMDRIRQDVPKELMRVIDKMMAKDPADRYATPREVADALAPFAKTPEVAVTAETPAPPAPKPKTPSLSDTKIRVDRPAPKRPASKFDRRWLLLGLVPIGAILFACAILAALAPTWTTEPKGDEKDKGKPIVPIVKKPVEPKKPRVLMVLTHQGFWEPDYTPVRRILEENDIQVKVASTGREDAIAHDNWGGPVKVDLIIQEARGADLNAVYFAGAKDSDYLGTRPGAKHARRLIQEMLDAKKPVAALCMGIFVLADGGFLEGKPASRPSQFVPIQYKNAAIWDTKLPVVATDDNIITRGDFKNPEPFVQALVDRVKKKP